MVTNTQVHVRIADGVGKSDPQSRAADFKISRDSTTLSVTPLVSGQTTGGARAPDFRFDRVYGAEVPVAEVFNHTVKPLLENFFNGYNSTLISFGFAAAGKSPIVEGLYTELSPFIFDTLRERKAPQANPQSRRTESSFFYKLNVRFFTVGPGEQINDLLDLAKTSSGSAQLELDVSSYDGLGIKGLTSAGVENATEILDFFRKAKQSRAELDLQEYITTFYLIELQQVIQPPESVTGKNEGNRLPPEPQTLISRFSILDLFDASNMFITIDPNSTNFYNAATKQSYPKSYISPIVSFANAIRVLAPTKETKETPEMHYGTSLLELLVAQADAFGGNGYTAVLGNLSARSDYAQNLAMINVLQKFKSVFSYPIKNEENYLGLWKKYKLHLQTLEKQLRRLEESNRKLESEMADKSALQCSHDESKLQLEKVTKERDDSKKAIDEIKDGNANLEKRIENLTKMLSEQQTEKLNFKKALLDIQIDNNKTVEFSENKIQELATRVLILEHEAMEYQMKIGTLSKENIELKYRTQSTNVEYTEITDEMTALRENYRMLRMDYEAEIAKSQELGVELITLVNAKRVLTEEKDRLENLLESKNQIIGDKEKAGQHELAESEERLKKLQAERPLVDPKLAEWKLLKDQQIEKLGKLHEGEVALLRKQIEDYQKTTQTLRQTISQSSGRNHQSQEPALAALARDLTQENHDLRIELRQAATDHQHSLSQLHSDVAQINKLPEKEIVQTLKLLNDKILNEYAGAFATRETSYKEEIERLRELQKRVPTIATAGSSEDIFKGSTHPRMSEIRTQLRTFTIEKLNQVEHERTKLLTRAVFAEEMLDRMQTQLKVQVGREGSGRKMR